MTSPAEVKEQLIELCNSIEHDRHMIVKIITALSIFEWNTVEYHVKDTVIESCKHMDKSIAKTMEIIKGLWEVEQ